MEKIHMSNDDELEKNAKMLEKINTIILLRVIMHLPTEPLI